MKELNDLLQDELLAGEPAPARLRLTRTALQKFIKIGCRGLAIIIFDETWGPTVRYYYLRRSKLVEKLLKNKAFPVELSIIGKYAEEIVLKDGTKILIWAFKSPAKSGEKTNYIVLEIDEKTDKSRLKPILRGLTEILAKNDRANVKLLNNIICSLLSKKSEKEISK